MPKDLVPRACALGSRFACPVLVFLLAAPYQSPSRTAPSAPQQEWEARGVGGGGAMYSPTINPRNPSEIYVACDMSPQFHTIDLAKHWTVVDFRMLQSSHESAVQFTRDPRVLWTVDYASPGGADAARAVRSTDGGLTWRHFPESAWPVTRIAYRLIADFDHRERALVSAEYRELWATRDGGASWDKKLSLSGDAGLHLAGAYFDGDEIYVCTGAGIRASHDGGRTFAEFPVTGMPPGAFISSFAGTRGRGGTRFYCVAHRSGWAGITGADCGSYLGVYTMDLGSGGWVLKTNGIAQTARPFFVAASTKDPDTAYVAGGNSYPVSGPSVYRTADGGTTWRDVFLLEGNRNVAIGWVGDGADRQWSYPEYALGFTVCGSDADRLVLTDLGCVHISTDGGRTWTQAYTTPIGPRAPGGPPQPRARYRSSGLEMTSIWQVAWFAEGNLFACATDIKGCRSTDGGLSWSFDYTGHDLNTMYYALKNPQTGVCYGAASSVHDLYESTYLTDDRIDRGRGLVLLSTDDGARWQTLKDFGHPVTWLAQDPRSPSRLYASIVHSQDGGIYRTDDLASSQRATWVRLANPPRTEGHPYNVVVLRDGTLVCTYSGRRTRAGFTPSSGVFVSTDGGRSWEDRSVPGMRYWTKDLVLDPADQAQNTWYACVFHAWGPSAGTGRSGLYRTTDRGKTWALLVGDSLSPTGVLNVESCTFDPDNPDVLYMTTEYDGLWICSGIRGPKPAFTQVASYPFRHPLRVLFDPHRRGDMWVTSFGYGMMVRSRGASTRR